MKDATSEEEDENIRGYVYNLKDPPLGNGTYGVVYKGMNTNVIPHSAVAIKKVSLYGKDIDSGVSCELLREYSFLQTLKQTKNVKGILVPIDLFVHENFIIIIYPLLEETLFHYLTRTKSFVRRQNIQLFQTLVDELICALHFCAHYNIRHNDMHASNVLVSISENESKNTPIFKLTDLGLCTYEPALPWLAWSNSYEWSYYQAPELAKCLLKESIHKSFTIDSRVDVWSLGVVLIEYGAPQSIKDQVKSNVHPLYLYDKQAHQTNRNDPNTIRLSMNGSTEYYQCVIREWKMYMFHQSDEIGNDLQKRRFYTRLFMLLQNIFTSYKMRWNIRTCFEYWIEHKTKLVIRDYYVDDRIWLSKFSHILTRLQHQPFVLTLRTTSNSTHIKTELPIWADLIQYWFDESHNLIYVLECLRLLYDYFQKRSCLKSRICESATDYVIYKKIGDKENNKWGVAFVLSCAEWDELNQALFGLTHKLLHNVARPEFKTNPTAERKLLQTLKFDAWSSWIRAPIANSNLSFDPKHVAKDIQSIQNICNTISKNMFT